MEPSSMNEQEDNKSSEPVSDDQTPNNWTIIIYHSGDSDLSEEFVWAFKEMIRVGTPPKVEVVALMDTVAPNLYRLHIPASTNQEKNPAEAKDNANRSNAPLHAPDNGRGDFNIFDKRAGWAKVAHPLEFVREEKIDERNRATNPNTRARGVESERTNTENRDTGNEDSKRLRDMASSSLLRNFVTHSIEKHPARHYLLLLSGHGSGMIGETFLLDRGAGRFMSIPRLDWALGEMVEQIGIAAKEKKQSQQAAYSDETGGENNDPRIDVLGFDACAMMTAEVAFLLKDEVKYMVASQGFMTTAGWPYFTILEYLKDHSDAAPGELASEIVRRCVRYYSSFACVGQSVDMSACDLNVKGWFKLTEALRTLTQKLRREIRGRSNTSVTNAIIAAHWYAQSYAIEQYVDLYDFCEQLMEAAPEFAEECNDVINSLTPLIKKSCYAGRVFSTRTASRSISPGWQQSASCSAIVDLSLSANVRSRESCDRWISPPSTRRRSGANSSMSLLK